MEKVLRDYEKCMRKEYKYSYADNLKCWHFPIFNDDFANFEAFLCICYGSVFNTSAEQVVTSEGFVVCHNPSVFL